MAYRSGKASPEIRRAIGARLLRLRESAGISKPMAARATGLTRETFRWYERGTVVPSVEVLMRLCRLYRVPADYILFGGRENDWRRGDST